MDFEQGKTYEFVASNGASFRARFDGFGPHMSRIWTNPDNGARIDPLPPIKSYRQID